MSGEKWTTKTGKRISVRDMSERHLVNTISLLERKERHCGEATLAVYRIESMLQGGQAQIVINRDIQRVESEEGRVLYWLGVMREELARRTACGKEGT